MNEVMAGVGCDVTALVAGINGIQFIAVPNHYICFLFLTSSIAQTRVPEGLTFLSLRRPTDSGTFDRLAAGKSF